MFMKIYHVGQLIKFVNNIRNLVETFIAITLSEYKLR